jgi:hypothetical protein
MPQSIDAGVSDSRGTRVSDQLTIQRARRNQKIALFLQRGDVFLVGFDKLVQA